MLKGNQRAGVELLTADMELHTCIFKASVFRVCRLDVL